MLRAGANVLHEGVVAVLRDPLERERLEVVPHPHVLEQGQFLPLDVVVEVARLVGEGEVDAQRVLEDLEHRASGTDTEPAKLRAVLQITDARPADRALAKINLIGLHLAGDHERRLLRVLLLFLVARVDKLAQAFLDGGQPVDERFRPLASGLRLGCRPGPRLQLGRRGFPANGPQFVDLFL
jgi:hypothetical protein